ncbi:MAG: glycerophosphodiester phosphodiesterase family protein [Bacteroidales bacterium]|nr:glycerophosphodiester phosphodiesterase family protein [Bacteroidales bacterium]
MLKKSFLTIFTTVIIFSLFFCRCNINAKEKEKHYLKFKNTEELQEFFRYKGNTDKTILVSGHRGGIERNYPENSIEVMEDVLSYMPAFFEIDPRLTKDSVIVLMHDATLDRTTSGKGKLSDYTYAELASIRLKDINGNITPYKIPTLEEVIVWSKGKTIINLDKKDVPFRMLVELIKKHKAENHVMLTVHTGAQARYYYDRLPEIMLSAFSRDLKEYEDMVISGVPWQNMIAYVGPAINEKNKEIVSLLHSHGVKCMVSFAPTHDKLKDAQERKKEYEKELLTKPDIIESDLPVEVWATIK